MKSTYHTVQELPNCKGNFKSTPATPTEAAVTGAGIEADTEADTGAVTGTAEVVVAVVAATELCIPVATFTEFKPELFNKAVVILL